MKPTVVLLLATVALVGAAGVAGASNGQPAKTVGVAENPNGESEAPPWPDDDTTTENETDDETTSISPGQQLAGAVGAQGASVQGELWNRTLSEQLANATTSDERAEVLADEVETLESYVDALDDVRTNVTEAWEDGELSEGEYRASLSAFVVRAYTVEKRANQTARATADLTPAEREANGLNVTDVRTLAERAHELYQFEDEIGQEVANETLSDQSALVGIAPDGQRANRTRSGQ